MTVRTSRFGRGFQPASTRRRESRLEIFEPTRGFDGARPPQKLGAGFTPDSRNFVVEAGGVQPRSGLSQFGDPGLSAPTLTAREIYTIEGAWFAAVASTETYSLYKQQSDTWSQLSYVPGTGISPEDPISHDTRTYPAQDFVYDLNRDENIAVYTNGVNFPKFWTVENTTATYSDLTEASSLLSKADQVQSFDDRLVWFNVESDGRKRPTRVVWSSRGNPFDYDIASGAGFEDLFDMKGEGTLAITDEDIMYLFSTREVWIAQPRRDAFAFDFQPVNREISCPFPQSAARTPDGVAFLGRDLEVYLLSGTEVVALGPAERGGQSRIQEHLQEIVADPDRAWGVYNRSNRRYELYFPDTNSASGYPNRALYFDFETGAWSEQRFSHELSIGMEFTSPDDAEASTWDNLGGTWDTQMIGEWNLYGRSLGFTPARQTLTFSSNGTSYRLRPDQTTDDGSAIDCRWRSHGLGQRDPMRFDWLDRVQVEYESDSASSFSVQVSDDLGANFFTDGPAINASASSGSVAEAAVRVSARHPQFEVRLNDGSRPKLTRFQAFLRDGGDFSGGR